MASLSNWDVLENALQSAFIIVSSYTTVRYANEPTLIFWVALTFDIDASLKGALIQLVMLKINLGF